MMDNSELLLFVVSVAAYYGSMTVFVPKICKTIAASSYEKLAEHERKSVHNDIVSGVNGAIAFVFAALILLTVDFSRDYIQADVFPVRALAITQAAYFVTDFILLCRGAGNVSQQWVFCIHHVACLTAYYMILVHSVCQFHMTLRTINEMSTLFFNARSALATLKMKETNYYFVNGVMFMVTFFVGRVMIIPLHYYTWVTFSTTEFMGNNPYVSPIFYTVSGTVDVLNVYWFSLVFRGFLKYYYKSKLSNGQVKAD